MSKDTNKIIKNRHVLIVGAGSSLSLYWEDIKQFIAKNNVITVGINRINHILTPDYHLWADKRVYNNFGGEIDKKSIIVFGDQFDKKTRKVHWSGPYEVIRYTKLKWETSYDDPTHKYYGMGDINYKKEGKKFYGVFRTAGSLAILWSHVNEASRISVVGMDGYTFYSKEELSTRTKERRQHCYGKGYTDSYARNSSPRSLGDDKKKEEAFHKRCMVKDGDIYRTLRAIKKYGVKFEIITPTVYSDFYNPKILDKGSVK